MAKNEQNDKVNEQGGTAVNTRDTAEGKLSELHKVYGTTTADQVGTENGEDLYALKNSDGLVIARGTIDDLERNESPEDREARKAKESAGEGEVESEKESDAE